MSSIARVIAAGAAPLVLFWSAAPAWTMPARRSTSPRPKAIRGSDVKAPPASPRGATVPGFVAITVAPPEVSLHGRGTTQSLAVLATHRDGTVADVTGRAVLQLEGPGVARLSGGVLHAVRDGTARLRARVGPVQAAPVTVRVGGTAEPPEPDFERDVAPVLARAGCNSTACHGSPVGKGGLKLSLFGDDPAADHRALATERRVRPSAAAESLVLLKATGATSHGGGARITTASTAYRSLLGWIHGGAPGVPELAARVQRLVVHPAEATLAGEGAALRLVVTAHLTDGSTRDATQAALYSSNDDAIAAVGEEGAVTARASGETAVMVRYLGHVAVVRLAVLPPWRLGPAERSALAPSGNPVDDAVRGRLGRLHLVPSPPATDSEFHRRAWLDLCGIIPPSEATRAFLADSDPRKREKLVDRLLGRPEFVDLWTLRWSDWLRNNPRLTRRGLLDYHRWIREKIEKNRPYDEFVRELLTATGRNAGGELTPEILPPQQRDRPALRLAVERINREPFNAAANYYAVSPEPLDAASATAQLFLGVRLECARCHNHPFERWTQADFYGMAAYFSGLSARGRNFIPTVVTHNPRAAGIRHPATNEVVEPRPLDGTELPVAPRSDGRVVLANWLTSPGNPYLARAYVNRIWAHYFGRGIVDPVDDFRETNPPSNPELLEVLAREFVRSGYDARHVHRLITTSATYAQSSRPNRWNAGDRTHFARQYPRRLMAEQLYDSISQATGVFLGLNRFPGGRRLAPSGPFGALLPDSPLDRVTQIPALPGGRAAGGPVPFLDTFGRPRREVACECERSSDGSMGQALALINGDEVNRKIAAPAGRIRRLARGTLPAAEVVEELYLATLCRPPTDEESREAEAVLRAAATRVEGVEDVAWALLNSREFLFIH